MGLLILMGWVGWVGCLWGISRLARAELSWNAAYFDLYESFLNEEELPYCKRAGTIMEKYFDKKMNSRLTIKQLKAIAREREVNYQKRKAKLDAHSNVIIASVRQTKEVN